MTPSTMRVRAAVPADFPEMLQIWRDASRVGHPFFTDAEREEQAQRVREHYFPLADNRVAEDEQVRGFIGLIGNHIGGLFVAPSAHRSGIGRLLVEDAAAIHADLTVEVYESNRSAVAFYERCGFAVVGRKPVDDDGRPLPLLRMERRA